MLTHHEIISRKIKNTNRLPFMSLFKIWTIPPVFLSVLLLLTSCQHLEGQLSDDEEVVEPKPEITEEVTEAPEDPDRPSWYDAANPVWEEGDTLFVAAAAVAADSSDARKLAFQALPEITERAFNRVIESVIEQRGIEAGGTPTNEEKEFMLQVLAYNAGNDADRLSLSEETFYYQGDSNARFYVKRSYLKSAMAQAVLDDG